MPLEDLLTLKLDDEGDLVLEEDDAGNLSFATITGENVVRQDIQVRVLTALGERILHPDYGLDFPSLEVAFDENLVRGEVVRAILEDPDVAEILDIEILFEGRTRHAKFQGSVRLKDNAIIGIEGLT